MSLRVFCATEWPEKIANLWADLGMPFAKFAASLCKTMLKHAQHNKGTKMHYNGYKMQKLVLAHSDTMH